MPNQTFLFYSWEPSLIIEPGTEIVRMVFEEPIMCDINETFVALPAHRACDFRIGQARRTEHFGLFNAFYKSRSHGLASLC